MGAVGKVIIGIACVFIAILFMPYVFYQESYADGKFPLWVKNIFTWYGQGQVSEDELLSAIKYLVQQGIIKLEVNSSSQSSTNPNTSKNSSPASSNSILTNSDFEKIDANVDGYKDSWARFSGKIANVDTTNGVAVIALNLAADEFGKEVFVILNNGNQNNYVKDDCVVVEGKIYGKEDGQNVYGGIFPFPRINGEKINKMNCLDAMYPSLKTVTVNISKQAGNVKLTINKVEFAQKHTRVFMTIQDLDIERKATFLQYDSHIVQDQSQYSYMTNFVTGQKDIDTTILPGVVESGYIFYDPVPQKSFKLLIEADEEYLSSDYNNNINLDSLDHKFTFDIPIQ